MAEKKIQLGMDRFLNLKWADYAFDLSRQAKEKEETYAILSNYLSKEISGKESARKTANQLKRLWLDAMDSNQVLRSLAKEIMVDKKIADCSILHLGMAINVFPILKEVCNKIGTLSKTQGQISRKMLVRRVIETYANPSSIPRIIDRVIQTLADWGFLLAEGDIISPIKRSIEENDISAWFVLAILKANGLNEIPIPDLQTIPTKMVIELSNIRTMIQQTSKLRVYRNFSNVEIIAVNHPAMLEE